MKYCLSLLASLMLFVSFVACSSEVTEDCCPTEEVVTVDSTDRSVDFSSYIIIEDVIIYRANGIIIEDVFIGYKSGTAFMPNNFPYKSVLLKKEADGSYTSYKGLSAVHSSVDTSEGIIIEDLVIYRSNSGSVLEAVSSIIIIDIEGI